MIRKMIKMFHDARSLLEIYTQFEKLCVVQLKQEEIIASLQADWSNRKRERDISKAALFSSEKEVVQLQEENARLKSDLENYETWPCEFSSHGWRGEKPGCTASLGKMMARNCDDPSVPGDGHGIFVCGVCYNIVMEDRNQLKFRIVELENQIKALETKA